MKVKKLLLAVSKGPDISQSFCFDTHPLQRGLVRDWRDDEISGILKTDKPSVEQMVDAGCQK